MCVYVCNQIVSRAVVYFFYFLQVQLSLEAHPQLEVQSQPPMMMMMIRKKLLVVGCGCWLSCLFVFCLDGKRGMERVWKDETRYLYIARSSLARVVGTSYMYALAIHDLRYMY